MEIPWNFFDDLLPPEVTTEIFSYFSLEDAVYVSLVCKNWNVYFDTKEIWKRIFVQHFDYIDKKRLNLTQIVKWRKLCINSINAKKWSRNFEKTTTTCYYQYSSPYLKFPIQASFLNQKNHFFVYKAFISAVDIKMAGKLAPVKANPVKIFSPLQYKEKYAGEYHGPYTFDNDLGFKYHMDCYDQKANKDDSYKIVKGLAELNERIPALFGAQDENGRMLVREPNRTIIWDYSSHNTINKLPFSVTALPQVSSYSYEDLNSRYVSWISPAKDFQYSFEGAQNNDKKYGAIDLNKKCAHHQKLINKTTKWEYEIPDLRTPCRPEVCAMIGKDGHCNRAFTSHVDPSLILFFLDDKIDVWKSGKSVKEIPYANSDKNKVFKAALNITTKDPVQKLVTEHVTSVNGVNRHWIQFTMESNDMDLNDTDNRIVVPKIDNFQWVPKENKIVLISHSRLVVYDLDRKSWSVKMTFEKEIKALTFNSTGNILFVADDYKIYMAYWRAGIVLGSIDLELQRVTRLQLALDQILVLTADNYVLYKKMAHACNL